MRRKRALASLLLGLLILTGGYAKSDLLKIELPKNHSIFDDAFAPLVIKFSAGKIKNIEINSATGEHFVIKNIPKSGYYCKNIKLKLAENDISVTAHTEDNRTVQKSIKVFYRSEVYERADEAPYGYKKYFFHNSGNEEKSCTKCHDMNPDFKEKSSPQNEFQVLENPKDSNCYTCHKVLVSRKNGHAPSVNFMCTVCHNGKTGENNLQEKGKSRYLHPDPIADRCFECHQRLEENMVHNRSDHGPTKSGRCNKCHNPHSSPNAFFLRKPIWQLCTTCHAEKTSGKHVISSFVFSRNKGGHPTRGWPDPSRPGRQLVCSSCHNPHGSKGPFLLRTTGSTPFKVCKRCHKK